MKKSILFLFVIALFTTQLLAQKAEVIYFKANLPCCHAKACNNLESQIRASVDENFESSEVVFRVIKIADLSNSQLVEKHSAISQTVVVVSKNKKKEKIVDITNEVRDFSRTKNKGEFNKKLAEAVNSVM